MAYIKKNRARTNLVRDVPMPSITNWVGDGGLRFNFTIGEYKISLTHMERDTIIERWIELEKEFLRG